MKSAYKCFYGQLLSMALGVSIYFQDRVTKKTSPPFYSIFIFVHLIILTVSSIRLSLKKDVKRKRPKYYVYILPSLLDFCGGIALNKSFNGTTAYLIVLLTQFIYPMSVATEMVVFKKQGFNFTKMGVFITLSVVCFVLNSLQDKAKITCTLASVLLVFLSNACYMSVTFIEAVILPELDDHLFLRDFSFFGIIIGSLYTVTVQYSKLDFAKMKDLYTNYSLTIVMYAIPLALFYLHSATYINIYGSTAFNASVISESVYIGLIHTFTAPEMNYWPILGSFICIAASVILVAMEKKESDEKPEKDNNNNNNK